MLIPVPMAANLAISVDVFPLASKPVARRPRRKIALPASTG
jgi:hypothetical protein